MEIFITTVVNPFSTEAAFEAEDLVFKCPTCHATMRVALTMIKQITGVNVICDKCKNVAHVPGGYKTNPKPVGLKITGSVRVAIAKFGDWYYSHPVINSLIKARQSDLLSDYGLWGFCGGCYHEYQRTVLYILPFVQGSGGVSFGARTPESAKDFNSLASGHCPSCGNDSLIVIVAEIPDYVRSAIESERSMSHEHMDTMRQQPQTVQVARNREKEVNKSKGSFAGETDKNEETGRRQNEFRSEKLTNEEYVREVARRLHGSDASDSPSPKTGEDEERAYEVERAHAPEREKSIKEFRGPGLDSRETFEKNLQAAANVFGHLPSTSFKREGDTLRVFWQGDPPTWAELRFLITFMYESSDGKDFKDIAAYEKALNGDYKIVKDKQRNGFWIIFQK